MGTVLLGENNPISVAKVAREGWTLPLCFLFRAEPCFAFHTFGSAPPPSMGCTFPILANILFWKTSHSHPHCPSQFNPQGHCFGLFCSQQLPSQLETLSQTGNPNSPLPSQHSRGTWGPWAPHTDPSCLPSLQRDNLGMGRAGA